MCLQYRSFENTVGKGEIARTEHFLFSSPEHEVFIVSYCDRAVSVVNFLPCVRSRGYIFSPTIMKLGQNVCFDGISNKFENGPCRVKN